MCLHCDFDEHKALFILMKKVGMLVLVINIWILFNVSKNKIFNISQTK